MEAWLDFGRTLIWQLIVIGILVYLHRSGIIGRLTHLTLSKEGFVIQLQEVKERQERLRADVDALRFLVSGFVTDWELKHLESLCLDGPFQYRRGPNRDDRFVNELVRLRDFGLIAKLSDRSLYDLPPDGNLKDHVRITERGKEYLDLRRQLAGSAAGSVASG